MKEKLAAAGRRLIHAAAAALILLLLGLTDETSEQTVFALGLVFLVAVVVAALKFVQEVIPALSWARLGVPQPIAAWLDAFTQAVLGTLIVTVPNLADATSLSDLRVAVLAVLMGALTAGLRAAEGLLTAGESPATSFGLGNSRPSG